MNRSAASSSSWVVMPGRTLPCSRFIVRTRIAPAAAIRSISSGDFLMIIALPRLVRLDVLFEAQRGDHGADVAVDIGGLARPGDPLQQPALGVVTDQRLGPLLGEPP